MRRQDLPVCAFFLCKMNVFGGGGGRGACDYIFPSLCVVFQTGCSVGQHYVLGSDIKKLLGDRGLTSWFDSLQGQRFFVFCEASIQTLGPRSGFLFLNGYLGMGLKLPTRPHLVPRLRMHGATPLLPLIITWRWSFINHGEKLCFNLTENYRLNRTRFEFSQRYCWRFNSSATSGLCIRCSYFSNLNDAAWHSRRLEFSNRVKSKLKIVDLLGKTLQPASCSSARISCLSLLNFID
jgi:hypothetical protein